MTPRQQAVVTLARNKATNWDDDVEIDDPTSDDDFSVADQGTWVRGWVWVDNADINAKLAPDVSLDDEKDFGPFAQASR